MEWIDRGVIVFRRQRLASIVGRESLLHGRRCFSYSVIVFHDDDHILAVPQKLVREVIHMIRQVNAAGGPRIGAPMNAEF